MTGRAMLEFAAALLLLAATPGPGTLTVTSSAAARGFRAGSGYAIGIVLGDCLFLILAVSGLAMLARALGALFIVLKIAGALYLLTLGVRLIFNARESSSIGETPAANFPRNLGAGFALTMANPKAMLFYLGFLPAFLNLSRMNIGEAVILVTEMALVVGSVLLAYAAAGAYAAKRSLPSRSGFWLKRVAGMVMIGAGIRIAAA